MRDLLIRPGSAGHDPSSRGPFLLAIAIFAVLAGTGTAKEPDRRPAPVIASKIRKVPATDIQLVRDANGQVVSLNLSGMRPKEPSASLKAFLKKYRPAPKPDAAD